MIADIWRSPSATQLLRTFVEAEMFHLHHVQIVLQADADQVEIGEVVGDALRSRQGRALRLSHMNVARGIALLVLAALLGGCMASVTPAPTASPTASVAPTPTASPTPAPTVAVTTAPATPTPTLDASVNVCGSLVRWASDGNTQLARVDIGGTVTEYRLQVSYGTTTPKDPGTGIPLPVRITGRQVPADSGSPQAINLVDYNLTRVSSCSP